MFGLQVLFFDRPFSVSLKRSVGEGKARPHGPHVGISLRACRGAPIAVRSQSGQGLAGRLRPIGLDFSISCRPHCSGGFATGSTAAKNLRNNTGRRTALMLASSAGHAGVVRLLLQAGADQRLEDDEGSSALMLAFWGGHTELVHQEKAAVMLAIASGIPCWLRHGKGNL